MLTCLLACHSQVLLYMFQMHFAILTAKRNEAVSNMTLRGAPGASMRG